MTSKTVGDPRLTIRLRKEYGQENAEKQEAGQDGGKWEDWLTERGYALDDFGQVYQVKR